MSMSAVDTSRDNFLRYILAQDTARKIRSGEIPIPEGSPARHLGRPLLEKKLSLPVESVPVKGRAVEVISCLHLGSDGKYKAFFSYGNGGRFYELPEDNPGKAYGELIDKILAGNYVFSIVDGRLHLDIGKKV